MSPFCLENRGRDSFSSSSGYAAIAPLSLESRPQALDPEQLFFKTFFLFENMLGEDLKVHLHIFPLFSTNKNAKSLFMLRKVERVHDKSADQTDTLTYIKDFSVD